MPSPLSHPTSHSTSYYLCDGRHITLRQMGAIRYDGAELRASFVLRVCRSHPQRVVPAPAHTNWSCCLVSRSSIQLPALSPVALSPAHTRGSVALELKPLVLLPRLPLKHLAFCTQLCCFVSSSYTGFCCLERTCLEGLSVTHNVLIGRRCIGTASEGAATDCLKRRSARACLRGVGLLRGFVADPQRVGRLAG